MDYPRTHRSDLVEDHFGIQVADPFRWLEADARENEEVAAWVRSQDKLARAHLAELPSRARLQHRLTQLFDHRRLTAPRKRGDNYFFTRNSGLDEQAVLVVVSGGGGAERILLDPSRWSVDGATALAEWAVSDEGRHVAFAQQDGGSDWRTIRVLDVETGAVLSDEVAWARFTAIAWAKDGSGFFYSRFPEPPAEKGFEAPVTDHAVYFHALGTHQAEDRLVLDTPPGQVLIHTVEATPDGRFLIVYSSPGAGSNLVSLVDLHDADWRPRPIVSEFGHNWTYAGNVRQLFFFVTDSGADRGRIVAVDLSNSALRFIELVPEHGSRTISDAALIGGRLLVTVLVDTHMELLRYDVNGSQDGAVKLPGIGTVGGFQGRPDDYEAFLVFTSYDAPTTIYRYHVAQRNLTIWAEPQIPIDLDGIMVEQRFYPSKDGTRIPLSVIRRADQAAPAPTILYGYGGYGISMLPTFAPRSWPGLRQAAPTRWPVSVAAANTGNLGMTRDVSRRSRTCLTTSSPPRSIW